MLNLFARSLIVLSLLFGLLFAVLMAIGTYFNVSPAFSFIVAIFVVFLQYLASPFIIDWIYRIRWCTLDEAGPEFAKFVHWVCSQKNISIPKFGIIEDGNPNAFCYGHFPRDARLIVTTGLLNILDTDEKNAVVAHELGHIVHWDFAIMTLAAVVPLVLYLVFRYSRIAQNKSRKEVAQLALVVMVTSYIAYIASQFIVLFLSRVREYYADQFSAQVTKKPNLLATALVKIAYGLARAPVDENEKSHTEKLTAARTFGIFDPKTANALAISAASAGTFSANSITEAMKWDLWNPWAMVYELSSTHPLPAKRIKMLELYSQKFGEVPKLQFRDIQQESYWDEFLIDLIASKLVVVGIAIGGLVAYILGLKEISQIIGMLFLSGGIGYLYQLNFFYPSKEFPEKEVSSLVREVKVSGIRSIPSALTGKIIGRGIPGLIFSEDIVLQTQTGFIYLDYRQPLRFLETLFGILKVDQLIGMNATVIGWYRRAPHPFFEVRDIHLENGKHIRCYFSATKKLIGILAIVVGLILLVIGQ